MRWHDICDTLRWTSAISKDKKMKYSPLVVAVLLFCVAPASAAPIDLSTWITDNSFDFAGGQLGGVWTVSGGGNSVFQSVNGDPTIFHTPGAVGNIVNLSGTFSENAGDDDFVGFAFGYNGPGSGFYIFDWKQGSQTAYSEFASQGITLKRFDGTPTTQGDFWTTASQPGVMTQLYHNSSIGRTNGVEYGFNFTRIIGTGEISISLLQGATVLDSFTVFDTTYGAGNFGFYNFSQEAVTYQGFTADQITPVPEPTSLAVFSAVMLGLIGHRRLRRRS